MFAAEPTTESPLFGLTCRSPCTWAPRTAEAQDKAGDTIADGRAGLAGATSLSRST